MIFPPSFTRVKHKGDHNAKHSGREETGEKSEEFQRIHQNPKIHFLGLFAFVKVVSNVLPLSLTRCRISTLWSWPED